MRGHFFRRVIVCGVNDAGLAIARKCLHSPKFHVIPVAFLEDDPVFQNERIECLSGHESVPVAGRLCDIDEAVEKLQADEIWIALPDATQQTISCILQAAEASDVRCRFVPNIYSMPLQTITVDTLYDAKAHFGR